MQVTLKAKYTTINEEPKWIGKAKHKSFKGFGTGREGQGKPRSKGQIHPVGLSGRTTGTMIRAFRQIGGKSK